MEHDLQTARELYNSYEHFKEYSLSNRRFKHSDIIPLIDQLKDSKNFKVNKVGLSVQSRDVYLISVGSGKKKIFLWSQMHGDEPTATAAIFDIFNFFKSDETFKDFKQHLLTKATIHFLPMLNPDGAEAFERRNAFEIDLNRDAIRQQAPEAKLLYDLFNSLNIEYGFNLHDQSREYTAGQSSNPSAISFLAPPPDYLKSNTVALENSKKLIGRLYNILSEFIPGHLSRYSDDYEPRAFGDNFIKLGTSIILLETGKWRGDDEKQFLRKINFIALLTALNSIAGESYTDETVESYGSIPENESLMMDLIIRNVKVENENLVIDIGINYEEINVNHARYFFCAAKIEDIGDLSVFTGYKDINLDGYELAAGKMLPDKEYSASKLSGINVAELFKHGFTSVKLDSNEYNSEYSEFPFNIILNNAKYFEDSIKVENIPNFVIKKNDEIKYVVANGFLYDVERIEKTKGNGLIYR